MRTAGWLGPLPDGWRHARLKWTVRSISTGTWGEQVNGSDDDIVCIRVADFDRERLLVRLQRPTLRRVPASQRRHRLLRPGDLLLEKSGGGDKQLVGAVVAYQHQRPAVCSNFLARLQSAAHHHSRYLTYLHASLYIQRINYRSIKQTIGIQNLDSQLYFDEVVALPPPSTQRAIAEFLDRKTADIDALLANKQQLLALLRERRNALIHRAVTRGLTAGVAFRDTGLDTIGHLPAHWAQSKPKYFCTRIVDGAHHTPTYVDDGVPFITIKNLTSSAEISFADTRFISAEEHQHLCRRAHPQTGDVLITKDGTLGVTRVVTSERPFSIFVSLALLKLKRDLVDPWYVRYVLESDALQQQFLGRISGAGMKHLAIVDIANLDVPLPPLAEQRAIACYLSEQVAALEHLESRTRAVIERLREYRQATIIAAVTGQMPYGRSADLPDVDGTVTSGQPEAKSL